MLTLAAYLKDVGYLQSAMALAQWDSETWMPTAGAEARGETLSTLASEVHRRNVSEELESLLEAAHKQGELDKRSLSIIEKDYERRQLLPEEFVRQEAKLQSKAHAKWLEARRANNAQLFMPILQEVVDKVREKAALLGSSPSDYEALIYDYEPHLSLDEIDVLLKNLAARLPAVKEKYLGADILRKQLVGSKAELADLQAANQEIAELFPLPQNGWRLDTSAHPFSTRIAPGDCRITTRYNTANWADSLLSTIHEIGHLLYEAGLPAQHFGLPLGEAASLSVHESQSRFYENHVGRSLGFCKSMWPILEKHLQLEGSAPLLFHHLNKWEPNLIRTAADELHYHAHIILRYRLERALLAEDLKASDVPQAWAELSGELLGLKPTHDNEGCLQDIHWSHMSFGYFPTYTIGSLLSAQLASSAQIATLLKYGRIDEVELVETNKILSSKIYEHGRLTSVNDVAKSISGEELKVDYFITYLEDKIDELQAI